MELTSLLTLGRKRITFSIPNGINPPDVAVGTSAVVPIVNVRYTLISREWISSSRKYIVEIDVSDNEKMSTASNDVVLNVLPNMSGNPYDPEIRTQGGYVKASAPVVSSKNASLKDAQITAPSGVVIAVPVVLGVIAGLLGIGLLYLTVDKVEDVVTSPSVSVFIFAIALLILLIIWKQARA